MTLAAPRFDPGTDPLRTGGLLPEAVGRYRVVRLIGEGAFGRVFQALDPTLDQDVAVKVPASAHLTEQFLQRFRLEGRAAAKVRHPNVCRVLNADHTPEGRPYFVFDYVHGPNLAKHVTSLTRLPPAEAARIMAAVARGVAAAHAVGVIHRDLKPANVLMDQRDGYKPIVTDFGVARLIGADGPTLGGMPVGTLAYMPPEQGFGHLHRIGPHSDVFALGVMLYELLVGEVPSKDRPLFLDLHAGNPPPRPSAALATVPGAVCRVAWKAMHPDEGDRHPTAEAFALELEDWLRTRQTVVIPPPPPPPPPAPPQRDVETTDDGPGFVDSVAPEHGQWASYWSRLRVNGRLRAAAVGAAVGLVIVGCGVLLAELLVSRR